MAINRQNISEFSLASNYGKQIRLSIQPLVHQMSDSKNHGRLLSTLRAVIETDHTNKKGERTILNGDLSLLNGFNFNSHAPFHQIMKADYSISINKSIGSAIFNINNLSPTQDLKSPTAATLFKIITRCCQIDFIKQHKSIDTLESPFIPIDDNSSSIHHILSFDQSLQLPVFVTVAVQMFTLINTRMEPVKDKNFNSLCLIKTDRGT